MQPLTTIRREKRVNVGQGMSLVTADPEHVLTTVLGSCVACCLYDPRLQIGGMNHFLLAEPRAGLAGIGGGIEAERYGLYAMELLINDMLKNGSSRPQMRAHLYGGANLHDGMRAIGTANAAFAQRFLEDDGIRLSYSHLGGSQARRIDFRATSGQVRCRVVDVPPVPVVAPAGSTGDVELFGSARTEATGR